MGFFSKKKKTHVSSQTYNMAGNHKERMNFAKTNVIGSVLRGEHDIRGMGDIIVSNYISGPGISLRNINNWLERNKYWEATSQTKTYMDSTAKVSSEVVSRNVPLHGGDIAYVENVTTGFPTTDDIVYSYMLDKYPEFYEYIDLTDEEMEAEVGFSYEPSDDSNMLPSNAILVNYKGKSFTITVPNDNDDYHVIISYSPYKISNAVTKLEVTEFPPMYSWKLKSDSTTTKEYTRTIKTKYEEYEDGTIVATNLEVPTYDFSVTKGVKVWEKYSVLKELQAVETHTYDESVKTSKEITEVVINPNTDKIVRTYIETVTNTKIDPQKYTLLSRIDGTEESMGNRIYIYKYGSGNAELDSVIKPESLDKSAFFPVIPFRYNKRTIGPNSYSNIYKLNKELYKKISSGQKYDDFRKQVNSTSGIGDINTGFIQLGVSLSTKEPESKEYLYTFFRGVLINEGVRINGKSWLDETIEWSKWSYDWAKTLADSYNSSYKRPPIKPPSPPKPRRRSSRSISSYSPNHFISFAYSSGKISSLKGRYKKMKPGEVITESSEVTGFSYNGYMPKEYCDSTSHNTKCSWGVSKVGSGSIFRNRNADRVSVYRIVKQLTADSYEIIEVYDPYHTNVIKDGKSVTNYPFSKNDGGEESGCIVPLNAALIKSMNLRDVTQMSMSCKHITFTAWKITKQKWYQTGLFKIVMAVVIIVISIYFPPAGGAAGGSGMLGANAAIGAAIGLAGTAAIVAGAAINAIASMVVASVLSKASSGLFGDKVGAIVGAVATFIVAGQISGASNGMTVSESFASLMRAENIMSLTSAVGKGYMGYQQVKTLDVLSRMQDMLQDMQKQLDDVNVKMQDEFSRQVILDPLFLSDAFSEFIEGESSDEFINRTLMVGSDVVEMSHRMINNFAGINLKLGK